MQETKKREREAEARVVRGSLSSEEEKQETGALGSLSSEWEMQETEEREEA